MRADQELFGDGLPTYLTRFVGRDQELSDLAALVVSARVVTVCGTGGSGKSRMAVEFARRLSRDPERGGFRDGLVWVALAAVSEADVLTDALATALGLWEATGSRATHALKQSLGERQLLLVLDNVEQFDDRCVDVLNELLQACPRVSVLATSRRPLECDGEVSFDIPSLGRGLREQSDAIALFIDRASIASPMLELADPDVEDIRDICERVDALPLAIELLASPIGMRSPRDLLERLCCTGASLGSDTRSVDRRPSSIDSVLDITCGRLAAEDSRVLWDLGVFHGGFDRRAAEAVAGASLASLSVLADRSLIQRVPDHDGGSRYLVHELVRDHALERLSTLGDEPVEELRARHFDHFVSLVEQASAAWDSDDEQHAVAALAADQTDVDTAMDWAIEAGQADRALSMSAGLASLWIAIAPLGRSAALLARALDLEWEASSPTAMEARSRALNLAGYTALAAGDLDLAERRFKEALTLSELLADSVSIAWSLRGIGSGNCQSGDAADGKPYVQRSLALCREAGDDAGIAWSRYHLGEIAFACGRVDEALTLFEEVVASFLRLGIGYGTYRAHIQLGQLRSHRDELEPALASFRRALAIQGQRHFVTFGAEIFEGVAGVAARARRFELAATLLGAGDAWHDAFGSPRMTESQPSNPLTLRSTILRGGPDSLGEAYGNGRRLTAARSQVLLESAIAELTASLSLSALPAGLTSREVEVLRLVALGLSNGDIAAQLVVSPRTVHAHLRSIFARLEVTTRTAAAREAARLGLA